MNTKIPACGTCKHFTRSVRGKNVCDAFPNGIPKEIYRGRNDHREPFEGDNGIKWEPRPGFSHYDVPAVIEELEDAPGLTEVSDAEKVQP